MRSKKSTRTPVHQSTSSVNKRFEILEHTAEIGIRAFGRDLAELFANAGLGFFSLIADVTQFQPRQSVAVEVQAETLPDLMFDWLEELLFRFSTTNLMGVQFDIHTVNERQVRATMRGDRLDPARHTTFKEVKAITYQDLKVERWGDLWVAEVIFDI